MTSLLAAPGGTFRLVAALLATTGPLVLLTAPTPASAASASAAPTIATTTAAGTTAMPPYDRTSAREARRVDRVPAPKFVWKPCPANPLVPKSARCATIRVPLDYDAPKGPTTTLGVARVRAAKPAQRIGTLFVNPGGPGGSATDLAFDAPNFLDRRILDRRILDRFDIVGVDPRGVGFSAQLRCFRTESARAKAAAGYETKLPVTQAETRAFLASSRRIAKACSTTGRQLASHMSTAEVARDMDVVRRALGDKKLTYLGLSYGTQLGQVYANMFPDRVRALVLDGVLDPVAWTTGRRGSGGRILTDRIRSADASFAALRELLSRCDLVGRATCAFAGTGNSRAKFDLMARRIKKRPAVLTFPDGKATITYAVLVGEVLDELYRVNLDGRALMTGLQGLWEMTEPRSSAAQRMHAAPAVRSLVRSGPRAADPPAYKNGDESFLGVVCSDGLSPRDPRTWLATSAAAERRAPYFGRRWALESAPCAGSTWTAHDEDRYLGPFTRRTAAPVLVVGNYWDPGTSYRDGAVPAAKLLPNSRLLTSNSWGHTAYGTSACVSNAVGAYLIKGTLPPKGTICTGPQPFPAVGSTGAAGRTSATGPAAAEEVSTARPAPITPWQVRLLH